MELELLPGKESSNVTKILFLIIRKIQLEDIHKKTRPELFYCDLVIIGY